MPELYQDAIAAATAEVHVKVRLKAFGLHLAASSDVLTLVLAGLYLGGIAGRAGT